MDTRNILICNSRTVLKALTFLVVSELVGFYSTKGWSILLCHETLSWVTKLVTKLAICKFVGVNFNQNR